MLNKHKDRGFVKFKTNERKCLMYCARRTDQSGSVSVFDPVAQQRLIQCVNVPMSEVQKQAGGSELAASIIKGQDVP